MLSIINYYYIIITIRIDIYIYYKLPILCYVLLIVLKKKTRLCDKKMLSYLHIIDVTHQQTQTPTDNHKSEVCKCIL